MRTIKNIVFRTLYSNIFPGLAYRITRNHACGFDDGNQTILPLSDNDFGTCEAIHQDGSPIQSFGFFMDFYGVPPRSVGVIVIGHGFSCVPSDGVTIQIVYSNGHIMDCQASPRGKVCFSSCFCDHRCALALVTIPKSNSQNIAFVCELITGRLHVN